MALTHKRPAVCIVTPALAEANNGNWQTARRWARMLSSTCRVTLVPQWPHAPVGAFDLLIALHARRSASSIAAWAQQHPTRPLVVALTGTDLYRDIAHDASAQHSLNVASHLIVLQEAGLDPLAPSLQHKTRVVFQSCAPRQSLVKTTQHLRVVVVGHLRAEKSPQTVFDVAQSLQNDEGIYIDHIGHALDPALGEQARSTAIHHPHYRWLGGLTHAQARQRMQRAHVLLHPSQMEGGAHVVMEALCSGTPVVASQVSGNIGMLGPTYKGYFEWGNATAAANMLRACRNSLNMDLSNPLNLMAQITAQCNERAPLFAPAHEAQALQNLVRQALAG